MEYASRPFNNKHCHVSPSLLLALPLVISHRSFARVAYLGQSLSPLPELRISTSPLVCCPSCVSRPVPQFFARVAYLGQSTSSFARVAYLGQSINPLLLNLGQSFARTVHLIHLSLPYGPEATRARGHPLDSRSASARPLSGGKE
ncbi:hypothetical protein BHM03_00043704 [Ensete ventricosum]|nr:hypothetical protein BHM03_00043704 [Ensete ventricosum]